MTKHLVTSCLTVIASSKTTFKAESIRRWGLCPC